MEVASKSDLFLGMNELSWDGHAADALAKNELTFANLLRIDLNVSPFDLVTQTALLLLSLNPLRTRLTWPCISEACSKIVVGCCFRGSQFFQKPPRTLMCGFRFRRRGPH
jgi:hypothetical protein